MTMDNNTDWEIVKKMLGRAGLKFEEEVVGGTGRDKRTGEVVMTSCLELDAESTGTKDGLEFAFNEEGQLVHVHVS